MTQSKQSQSLKSSFSLFSTSVNAIKLNLNPFLWLVFLPSGLLAALQWVDSQSNQASQLEISPLIIITVLLTVLYTIVFTPAIIHLELLSARNKKVNAVEAMQSSFKFIGRLFGLIIVLTVLIGGGLLLLVVPGLIMLRRYFLAPYYLIDQDLSIQDAMRLSASSSKTYSQYIWGIIGVYMVLFLPSFLPYIGVILSIVLPTLYSVAPALRYNEIINQPTKT